MCMFPPCVALGISSCSHKQFRGKQMCQLLSKGSRFGHVGLYCYTNSGWGEKQNKTDKDSSVNERKKRKKEKPRVMHQQTNVHPGTKQGLRWEDCLHIFVVEHSTAWLGISLWFYLCPLPASCPFLPFHSTSTFLPSQEVPSTNKRIMLCKKRKPGVSKGPANWLFPMEL